MMETVHEDSVGNKSSRAASRKVNLIKAKLGLLIWCVGLFLSAGQLLPGGFG